MQITLDIPDPLIRQFINQKSDIDCQRKIATLLTDAIIKQTDGNDVLLPFEPLPSRGVKVTNDIVNHLRESEAI